MSECRALARHCNNIPRVVTRVATLIEGHQDSYMQAMDYHERHRDRQTERDRETHRERERKRERERELFLKLIPEEGYSLIINCADF